MLAILSYRLAECIVFLFPIQFSYRLSALVADFFYLFNVRGRRALCANLRHVLGRDTDAREISGLARRIFRNFAHHLVDFFDLPRLTEEKARERLILEGLPNLEKAAAEGKGIIIVSSHLGSWEVAGAAFSLLGHPISAVALDHASRAVTRFFSRRREKKGIHVIPFSDGTKGCLSALEGKRYLALLGDRNYGKGGVPATFFDARTIFPAGPIVLALKTGAPILPGFTYPAEGRGIRLVFEKPIQVEKFESVEESLDKNIMKISTVLEKYIGGHVDQWFAFEPVWTD